MQICLIHKEPATSVSGNIINLQLSPDSESFPVTRSKQQASVFKLPHYLRPQSVQGYFSTVSRAESQSYGELNQNGINRSRKDQVTTRPGSYEQIICVALVQTQECVYGKVPFFKYYICN